VGANSLATPLFIRTIENSAWTPCLNATLNYYLRHNMSLSVGVSYAHMKYTAGILSFPSSAYSVANVYKNNTTWPPAKVSFISTSVYYSCYNFPITLSRYFKIRKTLLQTSLSAGVSINSPRKVEVGYHVEAGFFDSLYMSLSYQNFPNIKLSPFGEASVKWWFLQNKLGVFASFNSTLFPFNSNTWHYEILGYPHGLNTKNVSNFNATINMRPQFINVGVCYKLGTHTRS
jgi:hypothetical protein